MPADIDNFPSTRKALGDIGPQAIYRARALAALGLSPLDPMVGEFFEDFIIHATTLSGWVPFGSGSSAFVSQVPASSDGVVRLTTGATAASVSSMSTSPGQVSNVTTSRWYHASRFRIPTTPDANSVVVAGLLNFANTKSLLYGFIGALNPTQFILQYDGNFAGSSLTFGAAVDTAFHIFEMYGVGSTVLKAQMDGASAIQVTQAAAPADSCFNNFQVRNGATAADQRIEIDWMYGMGARI